MVMPWLNGSIPAADDDLGGITCGSTPVPMLDLGGDVVNTLPSQSCRQ